MSWRVIPASPKYSINSSGQVRHDRLGRLVPPRINQRGMPYVTMETDRGQITRSIAKLVADNFLPQATPEFDTPINLDGDRENCRMENLMWRPRWFAIRYHQQFKDGAEELVKAPLRVIDGLDVFHTSRDAAELYGLLEYDIAESIRLRTYVWPTYQMFEMIP